jgi:hypothetical protein
MIERATNYIAAGAAASPWWLPSLQEVSETAALLLPVIGCAWLILQIISKLIERK